MKLTTHLHLVPNLSVGDIRALFGVYPLGY